MDQKLGEEPAASSSGRIIFKSKVVCGAQKAGDEREAKGRGGKGIE